MKKIVRMFKQIWRLATPYWLKSNDRYGSMMLLAGSMGVMILSVSATVRMNFWFADWTNAYVNVDFPLWVQQLKVFFIVGAVMVFAGAFRTYIDSWIMLRWRRWMTSTYLDNWMAGYNHYRMQLSSNKTDNPDQRIAEDIRTFIDVTWLYTFQLLSQLLTLGSFLVILWNLSNTIPLQFGSGGRDFSFSGYFIVIAFIWATIGTIITHLFGKYLIGLNFNQTRYEADFRFSLGRVRDDSEQIALLKGEPVEHARLMGIFNNVLANTFRLMMRNLKLGIIGPGFNMLDGVLVSLLLGPAYFAGNLPGGYGAIMQVAGAFATVLGVFKFFQTAYNGIAMWKAVINRLIGFLDTAQRSDDLLKQSKVEIKQHDSDYISIPNLDVYLPDGKLQITAKDMTLKHGEKILIKGKTGAGKTTLFRVLSGIWPYGSGNVAIPKNKKVILLPQKPYLPIGTLAEAVSYPVPPEKYDREAIKQALRDVDLEKFVNRLDEIAHWNHILSGGEQQRVGIARAMLYKPDYLFFDEATASMDEASEEALYTMLLDRMKETTIISIGHRSSLQKFHQRLIVAEQRPNGSYEFVENKEVS